MTPKEARAQAAAPELEEEEQGGEDLTLLLHEAMALLGFLGSEELSSEITDLDRRAMLAMADKIRFSLGLADEEEEEDDDEDEDEEDEGDDEDDEEE